MSGITPAANDGVNTAIVTPYEAIVARQTVYNATSRVVRCYNNLSRQLETMANEQFYDDESNARRRGVATARC